MDKKPKLGDLAQALMNLKWSEVVNLTVRLNVPFATLQKIEEDNAAGVRLLVALDAWLKSDRKASWKKVVRVLKELGMDVLAQEVEEKCKKLAEAGSESEEEEDRACSPVATTRTPPPTQCASGLEVPPNAGLHGGSPAGQRSPAGRVSPARQTSPAGRISPAVQDVSGTEEAQLLMEMHDVLLPAQTKSRFLALNLGVPPYAVDGIFTQFRDPKEQLLEVLKEFLTTTTDPSEAWPMIAKALWSRAIGLPRLAKSIEENYCSPPTHLTPHSSHKTPSSSHSTPHTSPSSHLTTHTPPSSHITPDTDSPVASSHPSHPGVCSASRHIVFETPQPSGPCHSNTHSVLCVYKVSVISKKTVKVTNEEQHIVWEGYGLRLHIPPNSLPEDCSELQLNMTVSRATVCELLDEDGILVSAVYSFSHNLGERKLRQKATLEMQHCVVSGSYAKLCILQSEQVTVPHMFHATDGGNFNSNDAYASVELDHFCSFFVYLRWYICSLIWNIKYCAQLYYTNINPRDFEFRLFIVPQLDALLKEIKSNVEANCKNFKEGPISPFEFDKDKEEIRLVVPSKHESGWIMKNVNCDNMEVDDLVNMRGVTIPFIVHVKWTEDHPPVELTYDTVIEGAKKHKLTVLLPSLLECETIANTTISSSFQEFEGLPPPSLKLLMSIVGVDVQAYWDKVGLELGLQPSALESIEKCHGQDLYKCMTKVFTVWHDSQTSEYSWKKLAEVLCSRTVNKPYLFPKMLERIHHSSL